MFEVLKSYRNKETQENIKLFYELEKKINDKNNDIKRSMIKNLISCIAAAAFIEQRRRALKRFLTLVARHPVLSQDEAVKFFLTAGGNDVATRIKDKFKNVSEEYTVHPQADAAEVSIIITISCHCTRAALLLFLFPIWKAVFRLTHVVII